jgi:SAM-dependent methyltransferase
MRGSSPAARACPVCDSLQAEVLLRVEVSLREDLELPGTYDVVACQRCGLVFQVSGASLQDYERYYRCRGTHDSSPTIDEESGRLFEHYIAVLQRLVSSERLIVDVGCAGGAFLELLRGRGYRRLLGVDPSAACVEEVRSKGIEARVGEVYSLDAAALPGAVDLFILSGVMEHLLDPRAAIRALQPFLSDSGLIFISVPDAARYGEHDNSLAYYFNHEHINHFSPTSLDNLMSPLGQRPLATHCHTVWFGGSTVPIFFSVYGRGAADSAFQRDDRSTASVTRHLARARARRATELQRIQRLADSGEELVVWGAGCVAAEALAATCLGRCRIRMFVDKDSGKQGKVLHGRPIRPPAALHGFSGTIVVCAAVYGADIVEEIRGMGIENMVVVLR